MLRRDYITGKKGIFGRPVNGRCDMGRQNPKGKVIKHFTIEVVDADFCPALKHNPCNPYSLMSDEERIRDLVDIGATLLNEMSREDTKEFHKARI